MITFLKKKKKPVFRDDFQSLHKFFFKKNSPSKALICQLNSNFAEDKFVFHGGRVG